MAKERKTFDQELQELITPVCPETKGIIPRVIDYVFQEFPSILSKLTVRISYIEIYNDHIIDLLEE